MKKIILSYSTGKDSLALWLYLLENDYEVVPVHYYIYPELPFRNEYMKYIKNKFNCDIPEFPSERYVSYVKCGVFQDKEQFDYSGELEINDYSKEEFDKYLLEKYDCSEIAVGCKKNDSITRKRMKDKLFIKYPILEWSDQNVIDIIKKYEIKLPIDYVVFGCSLDGYTAKWTIPFKKHLPKDFEIIKNYMPLIEVDMKRYDKIKDLLPNYSRMDWRKKKYLDMILSYEGFVA